MPSGTEVASMLTLLMTCVLTLRPRPMNPGLRLKPLMQVKSFGNECKIVDKLEVTLVITPKKILRIF